MKRSSGWNQEVTDEEGRRRFHGAFTGGFSAGYFNSVGTKEGWQPATFSSSRHERGRVQQRRAEDFMDEDDDPLLGKRLETTAQFDTLQSGARRLRQQQQQDAPRNAFEAQVLNINRQSAISTYPTMNFLDELVRPVNDSIGAKLLNRMGWKEGHGIGPRIRKKKIADAVQPQATDENVAEDEVVYIPPRNMIGVSAFPKPKLDKYGAGFDPYVNAPEFSRYKQHQENELTQKQQQRQVVTFADAMKVTSGSYETVTAFGLSALEDNDDLDVYGTTSMTEFNTAIGPARLTNREAVKLIDSEARESLSHGEKKQRRSPTFGSDGRPALPGFELACVKEKLPKAVALRLDVPTDFKPFHHFDDGNERHQADATAALYQKHSFSTGKYGQGSLMTAKQRAALLAEPQAPKAPEEKTTTADVNAVHTGSVFDLLGPEQKAKLFAAAAQAKAISSMKPTSDVVLSPRREPVERQPLVGGAAGTQFRANISASIAKRFVSASSPTEQQGDSVQSPAAQAPVPKHKPSYRSETLWIPKSLLCKRFHVKCLVGTQSDRDKASKDEEKRDLFDKELVPHLVEFAAERQSVNRERSGESGANNGASPASGASLRPANRIVTKEKEEDDELPPLPIVEKPAPSLLKSIFEPSDESAVEEDDDEDDEDFVDDEKEKAGPQSNHAIGSLGARVSPPSQNSLTGTASSRASVRSSFGDDDRAVVTGTKWNDTQQRVVVSSRGDRDRAAMSSDESSLSSDSEQVATRASAMVDSTARQQQVTRGTDNESDSSDTDSQRKSKKDKKSTKSSKKHKKRHKKHHHRSSSHRHADRVADDDESGEEDGRKHRKKRKESKKKSSSSTSKTKRSRSESRDRSEGKRSSRDSKHRRRH